MTPYLITYILAVYIASFKSSFLKLGDKKRIYLSNTVFAFLVIGVLIGFRNFTGIDDAMYLQNFNIISSGNLPSRNIEYSFVIICKFIIQMGLNYQAVFVFYAILSCIFLANALDIFVKSTKVKVIFIVLFFSFVFIDALNTMRQFLALAIAFDAIAHYFSNKKKKAVILLGISITIHLSMISILLFLICERLVAKLSYKAKVILIISTYITQYLPINSFISQLLNSLPSSNVYVRAYILDAQNSWKIHPIGWVTTLFLIIYMTSLFFFEKQSISEGNYKKADNIKHLFIYNMGYLYFISTMILLRFGYLRRISWNLVLFALISIAYIIEFLDKKMKLILQIGFFLLSLFLFVYSLMIFKSDSTGINTMIPYQFNFNLINK